MEPERDPLSPARGVVVALCIMFYVIGIGVAIYGAVRL